MDGVPFEMNHYCFRGFTLNTSIDIMIAQNEKIILIKQVLKMKKFYKMTDVQPTLTLSPGETLLVDYITTNPGCERADLVDLLAAAIADGTITSKQDAARLMPILQRSLQLRGMLEIEVVKTATGGKSKPNVKKVKYINILRDYDQTTELKMTRQEAIVWTLASAMNRPTREQLVSAVEQSIEEGLFQTNQPSISNLVSYALGQLKRRGLINVESVEEQKQEPEEALAGEQEAPKKSRKKKEAEELDSDAA